MADLDTGRYILKSEDEHGVIKSTMVFTRDILHPEDVLWLVTAFIKIRTERGETVYVYEPTGIHQPYTED